MIINPKAKAQYLVNNFYTEILKYDTDLSEEIIVSLLSIKHAKIVATNNIEAFKEACIVDKIKYWKDVLIEVNKM